MIQVRFAFECTDCLLCGTLILDAGRKRLNSRTDLCPRCNGQTIRRTGPYELRNREREAKRGCP